MTRHRARGARGASWCLALAFLLAGNAQAFVIEGATVDGEGTALPLVQVTAVDEGGSPLGAPHVSDGAGHFRLESRDPVARLVFADSRGARCLAREGPWHGDAEVVADFSREEYFTLRGRIVDEEHRLLQPLMREGATWSGEFDAIGARLVEIGAHAGALPQIRREGPWSADATVDLGLDPGARFAISGRARDDAGQGLADVRVVAFDPSRRTIRAVMAGSDGRYTLVTDRPVGEVRGYRTNGQEAAARGPWHRDATTDLVFPRAGVFTLRGRVTNR